MTVGLGVAVYRPWSCALAHFGPIDRRSQVILRNLQRTDTQTDTPTDTPKRATLPTLSFDIFHQLIPILESKRTGDQKLSIGQRQRITFIL